MPLELYCLPGRYQTRFSKVDKKTLVPNSGQGCSEKKKISNCICMSLNLRTVHLIFSSYQNDQVASAIASRN